MLHSRRYTTPFFPSFESWLSLSSTIMTDKDPSPSCVSRRRKSVQVNVPPFVRVVWLVCLLRSGFFFFFTPRCRPKGPEADFRRGSKVHMSLIPVGWGVGLWGVCVVFCWMFFLFVLLRSCGFSSSDVRLASFQATFCSFLIFFIFFSAPFSSIEAFYQSFFSPQILISR